MSETFVDSNGVKIWTTVQGQGDPILLCNGGPGCCDYLNPVAEMIDDLGQVIRFELISGAAHCIWLTYPTKLKASRRDFLSS